MADRPNTISSLLAWHKCKHSSQITRQPDIEKYLNISSVFFVWDTFSTILRVIRANEKRCLALWYRLSTFSNCCYVVKLRNILMEVLCSCPTTIFLKLLFWKMIAFIWDTPSRVQKSKFIQIIFSAICLKFFYWSIQNSSLITFWVDD